MCIFHKWKETNSAIGRANYFSDFSQNLREGRKVKLSLEKCERCSKERAFIIDQYDETEKIAVWAAKEQLGIE